MTSQQLDPFPAKTRPRNKNGAIFKPSLKHQKSRIQPNQKIFSLEHFRKKVDLFRRIKRSTVRCTLRKALLSEKEKLYIMKIFYLYVVEKCYWINYWSRHFRFATETKSILNFKERTIYLTRLEITAGQRTMSGMIGELTGQPFVLPVMLTGRIQSYWRWNKLKFSRCSVDSVVISM